MDIDEALAYLDDAWMPAAGSARAANLEARAASRAPAPPKLDRIARLVELMGDPQHQYPVIHLTGTNGKTSTARMITALLVARGLSVGTFTSPHLEVPNERISWNGALIDDESLASAVSAVAALESMLDVGPSYSEIMTAAAFYWFADIAVDVAVIEVGVGGTWDATNVADATVAVVTGVGIDHVEYLGPTLEGIAREKAGIVKPGSTLVLGETRPELVEIFRAAGASRTWLRGEEFGCDANLVAVGGRLLDLRTPAAHYEGVFLPLHGAHQGDNAACAVAATEAFFDAPQDESVVVEALGSVTSPGRLEVVRRHPLCVLDGVKNLDGARAAARTLVEEFGERPRVLVVGLLQGKDPDEMLEALDVASARAVIACSPPTPRAHPAADVAAAARRQGAKQVEQVDDVAKAVGRALEIADKEDLILITGSLYVVGPARTALT